MIARPLARHWLVAILLVGLSGCASGAGSGADGGTAGVVEEGAVQIVVINNRATAEDAVVSIVGGVRTALGRVPAGGTGTFSARLEPRSYQLSARTILDERSISFQALENTTRVTWDMRADRITVTRR